MRLDEDDEAAPGDPVVLDIPRERALRPEDERRPARRRRLAGGQVALERARGRARGAHVDGGDLRAHG